MQIHCHYPYIQELKFLPGLAKKGNWEGLFVNHEPIKKNKSNYAEDQRSTLKNFILDQHMHEQKGKSFVILWPKLANPHKEKRPSVINRLLFLSKYLSRGFSFPRVKSILTLHTATSSSFRVMPFVTCLEFNGIEIPYVYASQKKKHKTCIYWVKMNMYC